MIERKPVQQTTSDYAAAGANAANTITYAAAGAAVRHSISSIACSFSGGTVSSVLTVEDGGNTVWSVDLASVGPHWFAFPDPLQGSPNTALVVKLSAPGAGVSSKLSVGGHKLV